ncbi:hypothetical protein ACOBQB_00205 [Streptomyces sp. G5(2025)]|uniref:hypothetical protein n=1 Tax=Streptomyces sp. G5(2025) TaxID=3406628 RepID=UPI003C1B41D7
MSSTPTVMRIGRTYTGARRHPWVLGKIGDWTLPLGPYTPAQLTIAAVGIYILIKTFSWWAPTLGPAPLIVLGVAVWLARASRVGGRSPLWVAYGWMVFALQPAGGRVNGRTVRPSRPQALSGGFLIEHTTEAVPAESSTAAGPRPASRVAAPAPKGAKTGRRWSWRRTAKASAVPPATWPVPTPLQQMLRERQEARR